MREGAPTVFVIPPNDSLLCPLHFGVYEAPVDTPCGCTFCRRCIMDELTIKPECPVHGTPLVPEHLRDNMQAQGAIDSLLIHCQGGLQRTVSGEWVTDPAGCRLWLNLGKRKEHEDTCSYINGGGERTPAPVRTCYYNQHGCTFIGTSEQDIMVHGASCGYGRLLQQMEQLQQQLSQKDQEIERLNTLLAEKEQKSTSVTHPNVPNVNEVLDSITRGLEKLDHDSTRLFEDAKDTLKKTKTNIVNSAAYQTSLQVLHSIKEVVETAKTEFIAKLDELISKHKVRLITNGATSKINPIYINPNTIIINKRPPTTTTTTTTSTTTDSIALESAQEAVECLSEVREEISPSLADTPANSTLEDNNTLEEESQSSNAMADNSNESETEGDEDLKEFLEASKREYLKDQEARMAEEESIRHAVRLSLFDLANNS